MKKTKKKFFILLILFILLIFAFLFYWRKVDIINSEISSENNVTDNKYQPYSAELIHEIKEVMETPGINEAAIVVNGYEISKKYIEIRKLERKIVDDKAIKEIIDSNIELYVIISEAERLGIKPDKEKFLQHIKEVDNAFYNDEYAYKKVSEYVGILGITISDYLEETNKSTYNVFQKNEYRKYVEQKGENFEAHIQQLIKKADIKFYDAKLEKIYKS